ncbi:MAG: SCO family protein [Alphaproteobacteria bacterium]|nr:SCO family protein [Alphaproteobacteria bacterium]
MNKFLSIILLLMLVFTSVALLATKDNTSSMPPDSGSGKAAIGGAFTLTDQNGKQVSDAEFRGKQMLVFFGFTRCPEICPTTMATISSTMDSLGEKAGHIVPVFISVDSKHDTPERIKDFLSNFNPRIVGLTGSEEQIKEVASLYKTYYAEQGDLMDHSSLIYWMNEKGEYIKHFPYTISADELAKTLADGPSE